LIDRSISEVFFVIIASSCLRVLCPHGTSAKPARGATMHTSQQSSEVVAAAAVADSDALKLSLLARHCLSSSSSSLLLLLLLLSNRECM